MKTTYTQEEVEHMVNSKATMLLKDMKEAVLMERERCAKIADAHHLEQQGLAPGEHCCGPDVAHRIREGK